VRKTQDCSQSWVSHVAGTVERLHGRVDGIRAVVSFVSDTLEGLEREFRTSVDVYLEVCAEKGYEPERPFVAEQRRAAS
jgi:predicted HicB family RNase H-like nuclease